MLKYSIKYILLSSEYILFTILSILFRIQQLILLMHSTNQRQMHVRHLAEVDNVRSDIRDYTPVATLGLREDGRGNPAPTKSVWTRISG